MTTIWKYKLKVQEQVDIDIPKGAQILTVQTEDGEPILWVKVDTEAETEKRLFRIFAAEQPILEVRDKEYKYIGTYQHIKGTLIFHLFEIISS